MKTNRLGLYETDAGDQHEVLELVHQIQPKTPVSSGMRQQPLDAAKEYKTSSGIDLNKVGNDFAMLDGTIMKLAK